MNNAGNGVRTVNPGTGASLNDLLIMGCRISGAGGAGPNTWAWDGGPPSSFPLVAGRVIDIDQALAVTIDEREKGAGWPAPFCGSSDRMRRSGV